MKNLLHGGVDEEDTARQHDEAVAVDAGGEDEAVEGEEGVLEGIDHVQDDEEQRDAQGDGEDDTPLAHPGFVARRHAPRLDGDVEQVVEAQHRFQRGEDEEGDEVLHGEEIGHRRVPGSGGIGPAMMGGRGRAGKI